MGWEIVTTEWATKKQRQALYRLGLSRRRVAQLDKDEASQVIAILTGGEKDSRVPCRIIEGTSIVPK